MLISPKPTRKESSETYQGRARFQQHRDTSCHLVFFFLQGKAQKEMHAILRKTLVSFLPGRAKNLSAPLYSAASTSKSNRKLVFNLSNLPYMHSNMNTRDCSSKKNAQVVASTFQYSMTWYFLRFLIKVLCVCLLSDCVSHYGRIRRADISIHDDGTREVPKRLADCVSIGFTFDCK